MGVTKKQGRQGREGRKEPEGHLLTVSRAYGFSTLQSPPQGLTKPGVSLHCCHIHRCNSEPNHPTVDNLHRILEPAQEDPTQKIADSRVGSRKRGTFLNSGFLPGKKTRRICAKVPHFCKTITDLCEFSLPVLSGKHPEFRQVSCFRELTRESAIFWFGLPGRVPRISFVRGLLGKDPPDPTLESASPSHPQGSIWHRNRVKSGNRCRINVESMPN